MLLVKCPIGTRLHTECFYIKFYIKFYLAFPGGTCGKEPPANAGDVRNVGLILGSGRSPGGGHGNPF